MERHGEAAVTLVEGIRSLQPQFTRLPEAFGPLMGTLVHDYLEASRTDGTETWPCWPRSWRFSSASNAARASHRSCDRSGALVGAEWRSRSTRAAHECRHEGPSGRGCFPFYACVSSPGREVSRLASRRVAFFSASIRARSSMERTTSGRVFPNRLT